MKKTLIILVSMLIIGLYPDTAHVTYSQVPAKPPGKRALLVGVSKYRKNVTRGNSWGDLNSNADVTLLREMLITKFGFESSNIKVLRLPTETKKMQILDAFRRHLVEKTNPGDIIYFHFSGHGQQVPDDNGDETDGYDETIVPSDYISMTDGGNNIRDDELVELLEELSEKRPANVTVTFDSCYSGTAVRGSQIIRGGPPASAPVSKTPQRGEATANEEGQSSLHSLRLKNLPTYVFISATNQRQLARETVNEDNKSMGLFTWALIKALDKAGPQTSYRDLIEQVRQLVNSDVNGNQINLNQDPQVEGQLDLAVLGETALKPEQFFAVSLDNKNVVTIPVGKLQGMTVGSRFSIHPSLTKSTAENNQITEATIVKADALKSVLKLSRPVPFERLKGARAFEIEHNYGDSILRVAYREPGSKINAQDLLTGIKDFDPQPLVVVRGEVEKRYDVLISPPTSADVQDGLVPAGFNGLIIQRQNGAIIEMIDSGKNLIRGVRDALENEARRRLVVSLQNTDPNISISLRIIPVKCQIDLMSKCVKVLSDEAIKYDSVSDKKIDNDSVSDKKIDNDSVGDKKIDNDSKGRLPKLKKGDHIMLEVLNYGSQPAYVTILNVLSDGRIGPAWPQDIGQGIAPVDENLLPNDKKWHRLPQPYVFVIDGDVGRESFKAIATSQPSNFTPLIDPALLRGPGSRSVNDRSKSPLYRRFFQIGNPGTQRRSSLSMDSPAAWATATAEFEIVK